MIESYLKEVARGKRGARDLSYEDAKKAAEAILDLKASPAQIGAFLIAERIKMESLEELIAFITAARERSVRIPVHQGIDCTGPYDGRSSSYYASFGAAFVLAAAGLPVTLHGSDSLPPKWGITVPDMLRTKGIELEEIPQEQLLAAAGNSGILIIPTEKWCPSLAQLRPIRTELGMRTVFNTVEKLLDLSVSPYLAIGIFHNTVFERMSQLITRLGYRKGLIVQGVEGSEDLHIDRPTRVYAVENGEAVMQTFDPEVYELKAEVPEVIWTPQLQMQVTEALLEGGGDRAFANQVILNAGVRLHLAERVPSLEEGIAVSRLALQDGSAAAKYTQWLAGLQLSEGSRV